MVCLDTDFLIALLRLDHAARAKLEALVRDGTDLTTTPINACELFWGAYSSTRPAETVLNVKGLLSRLRILEFDESAAEVYGRIFVQMKKQGTALADMDALIAAIALSHNEPLLTGNKKHFGRVPGLVVDGW